MAQPEPMDVDCMHSDFDNKENTFHHNVPCTEKGYEELDVSELNMKLRYSMTPASSPMSKSYTTCPDNRYLETGDTLHYSGEHANLTRSLNSTITKNDNVMKSLKSLPLQSLRTEQFPDVNGNASVLRQLDSTEDANVTVTISGTNNKDEILSLPSSSSSALHTPEATTPTKEIKDEESPIMRGLKSVLNMFRSSTSPIPPMEGDNTMNQESLSAADETIRENVNPQVVASTPIAAYKSKDGNTSKSSPYKDSIVFNDDLETELNWEDQKVSSSEKMPINKFLLQNLKTPPDNKTADVDLNSSNTENNYHSSVEYMDVSKNESIIIQDKTMTELQPNEKYEVSVAESDSEFVDCETTFSKNESYVMDVKAIQEIISPKPNLTETKHISHTSKHIDFVDCDSTFSKNESYVLDIKEIQEKIFAKPNLDESKQISCKIGISPKVNQAIDQNVTSMSFANLDLKFDTTMPSDYSDYSAATTEILSELEKLEANIPSEIDTSKDIIYADITEQKNDTEQQVNAPDVSIKNVTLDQTSLEQKYEATESQATEFNNIENKCDELETTLTEDKNADITQSIPPKEFEVPDTLLDTVQSIESLIVSDSKNSQSQEVNPIRDNSKDRCEVQLENPFQMTNVDQILETTIIKDCNQTENVTVMSDSHESIESPTVISNDIVETVPSEIMQNDVKPLDNLNVIQNDLIPKENVNSSLTGIVYSEALSVMQNVVIEESLEIPPASLLLPDDVIEPQKTLDVAQSVTETQPAENPSDIPLPDDEVDKNVEDSDVPITSAETAPAFTSETIIPLSVTKATETVPESLIDTAAETKISFNTILSQTSEAQVSELATSITDNKLSDIKSLEALSVTEINSNVLVLPELNNSPLETNSQSPQEHAAPAPIEISSTASDIIHEKTLDTLPQNKTDDNNIMLSELGFSPNTSFNQTKNYIAGNVTQIIEDFHFTNDLSKNTLTTDFLANCQNISQIEPMDITLNENLNLTHELPDLVNQTIVLAEENVQNPEIAKKLANEPIQVELISNLSNVENTENLKTFKSVSANIEANSKTAWLERKSANEKLIMPKDNPSINDKKQPVSGAENYKFENVAMHLSDDQPPKVFTNTPDSEAIEVERPTIDEEIIVSANNSPYISLMSGVDTAPEKNEDLEKVEDAFEEIENPFFTKTNIVSSPPITSKGYNFNFDEIDDPFATKIKIRLSPSLDTPTKSIESENEKEKQFKVPSKGVVNRRKSQPLERKKPTALKKRFNTSFDAKTAPKTSTNNVDNPVTGDVEDKTTTGETSQYKQVLDIATIETFDATQTQEENHNESKDQIQLRKEEDQTKLQVEYTSKNLQQASEENKPSIDSVHAVSSDLKTTSSSEQSTYYSAGASSTESLQSKNVFNLPEIDDMNFNPFATKSKMRQSPPPDKEIDNPFATRSKIRSSPDESLVSQLDTNRTISLDESKLAKLAKHVEEHKMDTELMEKDTSANITDSTSSSRVADNHNTTREVNTEDEDTIEGPFLDVGDDIEQSVDFAADNDDMIHFKDHQEAAQVNEDNLDGELFIDAEAYEFLLNQNMSNVVADSGKESLFLKFDPLFAKRIASDGVLAALNQAQKKQSTPTKTTRLSLRNESSPIAGPSTLNVTYEGHNNVSQESNDDANITVTKPMMVVTPAPNPVATPRNKSITSATRSNRRSVTFTSPAIAVIDRLLSMSANNSVLGHDSNISIQSNGEQREADLALTQLRELLAEKEISVYNLRSESKELKDRLSTMESQVRILEVDGQERLKKINELNERLLEKTKINKSMAAVVEEYERTIASLIADIEQDKKRNAEERIRIINERDEQTAHLASMEVSFSDLHSKYEKSKQVILTCKANEDICKKTIQDFEEQVTKMQTNYEMLKQHATAKLNHANQELEKMNRAHDAEVVKLNAMIKRNHLLATSLQESLAQKTKANDELTAICDELINKVGSNK